MCKIANYKEEIEVDSRLRAPNRTSSSTNLQTSAPSHSASDTLANGATAAMMYNSIPYYAWCQEQFVPTTSAYWGMSNPNIMNGAGSSLEALAMATSSFGNNGSTRNNHSSTSPNNSSSTRNRNNSNARSTNDSTSPEKNGESSANKRNYDPSQQPNFLCSTPNSYMKNINMLAAAQWAASDPSTWVNLMRSMFISMCLDSQVMQVSVQVELKWRD